MIVRVLVAVTALFAIEHKSLTAQSDKLANVSHLVALEMTGELAAEYLKRTGVSKADKVQPGLRVETSARLAQKLDDGRIRVEHSAKVTRDDRPARLITITAIVELADLQSEVTPVGTATYASPAAHKKGSKPRLSTAESKILRLKLSSLKGVTLRTWTLDEELGG